MSDNLDEMLKEAPTLTLSPFTEETPAPELPTVKEEAPKAPEMVLTPAEQKMVDDFAAQIDITNTQLVLQYGAGSQKKIADLNRQVSQLQGEVREVASQPRTERIIVPPIIRTWNYPPPPVIIRPQPLPPRPVPPPHPRPLPIKPSLYRG